MNKKWLLTLSLTTTMAAVAACGDAENSGEENNAEEPTQEEEPAENSEASEDNEASQDGEETAEQPEMPEPDLEDIPDVVAEVNEEEILKEEFETNYKGQFMQAVQQSQMTGKEVDQDQLKVQIAENMVGTELLVQEAENEGYDSSEEEVNETLDEIVAQNGLESNDDFFSALEEQGTGEEEVMSQIEMQVKVDQLIESVSGDIEPTEEELKEAYEQVKAQQEQMGEDAEVPSFEEVKPDLKEQLIMQKQGEETQKLIEKLREEADVTINL